jgi:hypothetical protein
LPLPRLARTAGSPQFAFLLICRVGPSDSINIAIGVELVEQRFYRLHDSVNASIAELAALTLAFLEDPFAQETQILRRNLIDAPATDLRNNPTV